MGMEGDFYPPPMRENPRGFYENVKFRRQNDKMLAANNYRVKLWSPWPPYTIKVELERIAEVIKLLRDYHAMNDNWGWKDPRTSLTMAIWLRALTLCEWKNETRILQCCRAPEAVSASMKNRGNKEKVPNQFVSVARAYQALLAGHVWNAGFSEQLMKVNFVDLIHNTLETVGGISSHIGLPLNDISHIDPALERTVEYA